MRQQYPALDAQWIVSDYKEVLFNEHKPDVIFCSLFCHHFLEKDILGIKEKAKNKIIITTEKDFVRLSEKLPNESLFYLPIKSSFVNSGENFDKKIINYVGTSTRNR